MKRALIILATIALVCSAMLYVATDGLLHIALCPEQPLRQDYDSCFGIVYRRYPAMRDWNDSIHRTGAWRDTMITAPDGARLHGVIMQHRDTLPHASMMMIHGYTDNAAVMLAYLECDFEQLGMNVIVPERRGHGFSDGDVTNFGWLDRLDMLQWLEVAHGLWPDTTIVVHGLSQGAATTMMLSGEPIADSLRVAGFVEDCGYTTTRDELDYEIRKRYPALPEWLCRLLLTSASRLCAARYGFTFEESSSVHQVARCERPMLFIHGDHDDYVPSWMGPACYGAKVNGPRELWVTEGSEHARSLHDYHEEYVGRLRDFCQRWM